MRDLLDQSDRQPWGETLTSMRSEGKLRLLPMALVFAVVGLLALAVGWNWPKKYFAAATILVSEDKIIQKLMEGRAVTTGVAERAMIAREVIFSRRVMDEVLLLGGWMDEAPSAVEVAQISDAIQGRTVIGSPRENLIRIEYWDQEPLRAALITQHFADRFMAVSHATQVRESSQAVEFIESQAALYGAQLTQTEAALEAYRYAHPESQSEPTALIESRIGLLRRRVESDQQTLLAPPGMLMQGGSSVGAAQIGVDPRRQRLAVLEDELVGARLRFTEAHPDTVRIRRQLEELRNDLSRNPPPPGMRTTAGGNVAAPVNRAGLEARIAATEEEIRLELERLQQLANPAAEWAQLNRERDVARDLYQELLRRLEYARLSLRMDEQGSGLSFQTHEAAVVPTQAAGARFAHFMLGGLLAATMAPLGLLLLLVRMDPRVRTATALQRRTGLRVLASMPHYWNGSDQRQYSRQRFLALMVIAVTAVGFVLAAAWKLALAS